MERRQRRAAWPRDAPASTGAMTWPLGSRSRSSGGMSGRLPRHGRAAALYSLGTLPLLFRCSVGRSDATLPQLVAESVPPARPRTGIVSAVLTSAHRSRVCERSLLLIRSCSWTGGLSLVVPCSRRCRRLGDPCPCLHTARSSVLRDRFLWRCGGSGRCQRSTSLSSRTSRSLFWVRSGSPVHPWPVHPWPLAVGRWPLSFFRLRLPYRAPRLPVAVVHSLP